MRDLQTAIRMKHQIKNIPVSRSGVFVSDCLGMSYPWLAGFYSPKT